MPKFDYEKSKVFFRDSFVPFKDATVSIASSPVLYGLSIYTVFSVNWNEKEKKRYAFRLKDHYKRLVNSARIMDFCSFEDAWPYEKFEATMRDLIEQNDAKEDVLVRVTVFADAIIAGTKIHNLPHVLAAYVYPIGEILSRSGVHVCVSSWTRNPDNAIPPRAKVNGGYANACLMKNEALLNGYDDAIALDGQGQVTEGTVANIFLVRDGVLITPSVDTDILEGITRDSIVKMAREMSIQVDERPVDRSELYIAEEVFFCGSSARITPIVSIDKRKIGNGAQGTITEKLSHVYDDVQRGTVPDIHGEWRTEV